MTSLQMPSRLAMPCPFGGFGDTNITPISSVPGMDINFPDGFPSNYEAPSSTGGRFVTRKEINAIGNMASKDLFYHKCGGLNTWDPNFCIAIGGYPKGAVLDYLIGYDLKKVISLVDNNKVCFTQQSLSTSLKNQGLKSGYVDGENWAYVNEALEVGRFFTGDFYSSESNISVVTSFVAPKSGTLQLSFDKFELSKEIGSRIEYSSKPSVIFQCSTGGGGFIIKDITAGGTIDFPTMSSSSLTANGWQSLFGDYQGQSSSAGSKHLPVSDCSVVSGNKYMIAAFSGFYLRFDSPDVFPTHGEQVIFTFKGTVSLSIK